MLKAYLQALLNKFVKKSDKALMSFQSMPSYWGNKIDIYFGREYKEDSYIAPTDGFLVMSGGNGSLLHLHGQVRSRVFSTEANYCSIFVPVAKGLPVDYAIVPGESNAQDILMYFLPTMGSEPPSS